MAAASVIAGATLPTILRWVQRSGTVKRSVDMRMTVIVERPITDVFEFCRDFENFPRIVDVLLSVEDSQDGRSHWAVRSPRGTAIEWDAVVTKYVPNAVIAWESVPGSVVRASGSMRFSPLDPATTRVDIALTYQPMRSGLRDALRALVSTTSNTDRVRADVNRAARTVSETAAAR